MVRESSPVTEDRLAAEKAAQQPPPESENGHRASRPKRRHRLRNFVIGLLLLLLVLAVAIQFVLWSNLPRRLVLNQLQNQLGLRVQASSLSTGWFGNTNLREVTLALPMAEESFLDMPKMRVKHTSLFGLLLMRPVSVDLIELHNPTLYVRRDEAGRWNLQQVAELVGRAGGSKPADESAKQSRPQLPEVKLTEGTVVVQDYGKAETKIRPLNVHGRPDPRTPGILWRYDVSVPDHLSLVGQVVPGAPWTHEVKVEVHNVDAWVEPWSPGFPEDAKLAAQWRGATTGSGAVAGRLELEHAGAAGVVAKGVALIGTEGGVVSIRPDGVTVTTPNQMLAEAKLASGTILYDGHSVRTERLYVAAMGGQARLDAGYTLATRSGQLNAEWLDVNVGDVRHSGTLDARVGAAFQNRPQVEATLVSRGVSPDGPWDAKVTLNGTSQRGWADMDYTLVAPNLDWGGNYPLDLDGLTAKLETRQDEKTKHRVIRLVQLDSPGNQVESVGEFDLTNQHWKFWASLNALPIPGETGTASGGGTEVGVAVRKENAAADPQQAGPDAQAKQNAVSLAVVINAWGNPERIDLGELLVRGSEFELRAGGMYVYDRPSPLDVKVNVKHIPPRVADRDRPPIYGYISGEGSVSGTMFRPRKLKLEGKLIGEGVTAYNRSIGDVAVKVTGRADNNHATLKSEQLELLKGQWSFDALHTKLSGEVTMNLRVADLDLAEVGDLMAPFDPNDTRPVRRTEQETSTLGGRLTGEWNFVVGRADKDRIRVDGKVAVRDVRAPGFSADALTARTVLEGGTLTVGPINLKRAITRTVDGKETRLEGTADAALSTDLDDFTQIVASLNLQNWPLEMGESGWVDISGGSEKLVIDLASDPDAKQKILPGKSAVGSLKFNTNLTYKGQTLGKTEFLADLMGRMMDIRKLDIQTLDGNVAGNGVIELEKPLEARAFFTWENVKSERMVDLFPGLKGLEGVWTGRLRVQPSVDPRALGPLAIALELTPQGGKYNALQIGRTTLLGYADLDRFVLNDPADLASNIEIAGGVMSLWGRVSHHNLETTKDAVSSQLLIDFRGLDLNQILKAADPESEDTPGRLDGSLTVMAATRGPRLAPRPPGVPPVPFAEKVLTAITATGDVKLTKAKLGRIGLISILYDLMSLGQNVKDRDGVGSVQIHLENGTLELNNLKYFNRGVEARSPRISISEVWKLPDSPMTATAFGSPRPLASLNLPFIAEFDRLIALVSEDLVAIGAEGTVKNPRYFQLNLQGLARDISAAIFGSGDSDPTSTPAPRRGR